MFRSSIYCLINSAISVVQSWFSISLQILVRFLDVEEHDGEQPVDDAVIVALRDQTLAPHALYLLQGISLAEFV